MQQIEVYAKRVQAKHALFVFDSCFSGSIFAIARAVPEHITHKTANPVRQFITSGSADETVPDESIFRQQFIAALEGEGDTNGDGYVTGSELGIFLEDTVINYTKDTQHPQYGKIRARYLDKGDFVFQVSVTISVETSSPPEPSPDSAQARDPETEMWKLIEQSADSKDVEDFLAAFPDGKFAKVAQLKLKQLEQPQPATKKRMGTTTKIALGAGAVAALGGGIALVAGGGDGGEDAPSCVTDCAGVMVGCYCWYYGAEGQSCDEVCASHGGYHEATKTYAGSDGSELNCDEVLNALNAPPDQGGGAGVDSIRDSCGCYVQWLVNGALFNRCRGVEPTEAACRIRPYVKRACACNE